MPTRVLVVARGSNLRRLVVTSIANDGHTLNTAPTVAEALRKLRTSPLPVVAFFDYSLPDAVSALAVLPLIEQGGPELLRHRYVLLSATPLNREQQVQVHRLGVVILLIPCTLGDLTWHVTNQARIVEARQKAQQADVAEQETRKAPLVR